MTDVNSPTNFWFINLINLTGLGKKQRTDVATIQYLNQTAVPRRD